LARAARGGAAAADGALVGAPVRDADGQGRRGASRGGRLHRAPVRDLAAPRGLVRRGLAASGRPRPLQGGDRRGRVLLSIPAPAARSTPLVRGPALTGVKRLLISGAAQVLLEEIHGALPGEARGGLVVARGGVVVEPVLGAWIGEHLVLHVVGLQR